jgi:nucleotide-binding universal stress UspA family protein
MSARAASGRLTARVSLSTTGYSVKWAAYRRGTSTAAYLKVTSEDHLQRPPLRALDVRQGGRRAQTPSTIVPRARGLEVAMFKHILIATDGSELSDKAVVEGLTLAKALDAKVTAVTVTEPWDALSMAAIAEAQMRNPIADYEERMAAAANRILGSVAEKAKKQDVACATVYVRDRHPAEGIIDAAQVNMCDLIVMASHGRRGLARLLIGSQANRVVTLSPVPVLVCR